MQVASPLTSKAKVESEDGILWRKVIFSEMSGLSSSTGRDEVFLDESWDGFDVEAHVLALDTRAAIHTDHHDLLEFFRSIVVVLAFVDEGADAANGGLHTLTEVH